MSTQPEPDAEPRPDAEPSAPEVESSAPDAEQPAPGVPPARSPLPDAEELARIATPATVRHAPRYRAFVLTGVVLGVLLAFVVVNLIDADAAGASGLGSGPVFVFVALTFGVVGALLGALVALLLDRRSRR